MHIFASSQGDPMLVASKEDMAALHEALQAFLSSPATEFTAPAKTDGDPNPYERLLAGLFVRKTDGPVVLGRNEGDWLILQGSQENLGLYASHFHFPNGADGGHHHPENCDAPGYMSPISLSLIIEIDSTFNGESAA